jgi:ROS/MUCR transcriptional regulator protein
LARKRKQKALCGPERELREHQNRLQRERHPATKEEVSREELELYRQDPLREKNQKQKDFVVCRECGGKYRDLNCHIPTEDTTTSQYLKKWNYPELIAQDLRDSARKHRKTWGAKHGENYFGGKRYQLKPREGPAAIQRNPPTPAMVRGRIAVSQKAIGKPRHYNRGRKLLGKNRRSATWVQAASVDDATFIESRLAGDTLKEISDKVHITPMPVYARFQQLGLQAKGRKGRLLFLHGELVGKKHLLDVRKDFGVSKKVVFAWAKQNKPVDVVRPQPGEWLHRRRGRSARPTWDRCAVDARNAWSDRFCYRWVAGKKVRDFLASEIRDLSELTQLLKEPLTALRTWLRDATDPKLNQNGGVQPHGILNWIAEQARDEVAGRKAGRGFRSPMILWPTLKELNADTPSLLIGRISTNHTLRSQEIDGVINELLARDYGAARYRIDQAVRANLASLDPRTLGKLVRTSFEIRREKKRPGPQGPRKTEADKQFFKIGRAVENVIPRLEALIPMRRKPRKELLALGCSEDEIEAIRMPGSRTAVIAARWLISVSEVLPFDVVGEYHRDYLKSQAANPDPR